MNGTDLITLLDADRSRIAHGPGKRQAVDIPEGTVLFEPGDACAGFPIVLAGEIAVSRDSADGRSLELYRVTPGEVCLVSSASLFRSQPMSARGVASTPCRLVMLPPSEFAERLEQAAFRDIVLGLFADRLAEMSDLVDAVAFQRLDRRVAAGLLGRGDELRVTHQALAAQFGTAREIVSRILHRFEQAGWVALSRERITILDANALREHASGEH
ncbi:MAG: Crp/Fnr family transcriptional regulator [Burkholderiaceae bacterium]